MDIFSHALWTGALAKITQDKRSDTGRSFSVGWSAWWGAFPDLFAFVPAMIVGYWASYQMTGTLWTLPDRASWRLELAWDLYQISHSFITFIVVAAIVWVVRKAWTSSRSWRDAFPYALLGWPFHILLDIPTHRLGFFSTPFLWPISDYRFSYGFSWGQPWFMALDLIALVLVYIWLWKRDNAKSKMQSPKLNTETMGG